MFEDELKEGYIYKISNFYVKDYGADEMNRCVRNEKHLYFADFTTIVHSVNDPLQIPDFSLDIKKLVDTEKLDSDKRFLCGTFYCLFLIVKKRAYCIDLTD